MVKRLLVLGCLVAFIISRYIKQNTPQPEAEIPISKEEQLEPAPVIDTETILIEEIITIATSYLNVPYKQAGTTRAGMDCSGLVYTSFNELHMSLPRASINMSKKGTKVALKDVKKGDLVFFNIDRLKGKINHVGLVTSIEDDVVYFIHSTTKKGVIISSLKEDYWKEAFVVAKRVI